MSELIDRFQADADKLANFIFEQRLRRPRNESPVDCAIRIIGEQQARIAQLEAVVEAVKAKPVMWFHEAHGLHDEAQHQSHRPLDLCVAVRISMQHEQDALEALEQKEQDHV